MPYLDQLYQILHIKRFLLQFKMSMEMQWSIVNGLTKAQDGVAGWINALVLMQPNGCSNNTSNEHTPFECKLGDQGFHLFILGCLSNKIMVL
jgi:hypothetical protein